MDAQNTVQLCCIWLHEKASEGEGKNEQRKLVGRMSAEGAAGFFHTTTNNGASRERLFGEGSPTHDADGVCGGHRSLLGRAEQGVARHCQESPEGNETGGCWSGLRLLITEGGKEGDRASKKHGVVAKHEVGICGRTKQ